jgi:hypothetical protein
VTHPFEIQPVIVGEEDVTWTTWDDPDATFGVYERIEGLAMWLADFDTAEQAERDIKFLLTRDGTWALLPCDNDDCAGDLDGDWEDHAHPPVGERIRVHDTANYLVIGQADTTRIEAGAVGTVLATDTDNHSAIVAIPSHPAAWVPLIDIAPAIERY